MKRLATEYADVRRVYETAIADRDTTALLDRTSSRARRDSGNEGTIPIRSVARLLADVAYRPICSDADLQWNARR